MSNLNAYLEGLLGSREHQSLEDWDEVSSVVSPTTIAGGDDDSHSRVESDDSDRDQSEEEEMKVP